MSTELDIREEIYNGLSYEELSHYIINENNKKITKTTVEKILNDYDVKHKIKNIDEFQLAMIHTSYLKDDIKNNKTLRLILTKDKNPAANNNIVPDEERHLITLNKDIVKIDPKKIAKSFKLQDKSYERLELLGDSVIRLILTEYLLTRFEEKNEGFLTRLRTKMENGEILAMLSRKIKLNEYAVIARFYELQNSRQENIHILEDVMEAFMGALHLEAGYTICKTFFVNLIQKEIDITELLDTETNYKDVLLQYHHVQKWCDPEYGMLEQFGTEKKMFKMFVNGNNNNIAGIGVGPSKKKGEQDAARNALISYGAIKEHDDDTDDEYYSD